MKTLQAALILVGVLSMFLFLVVPAQAAEGVQGAVGIFHPAEVQGDDHALLDAWLEEIEAHPKSIDAELALRWLDRLEGSVAGYNERLTSVLTPLLDQGKLTGIAADLGRAHLRSAAEVRGDVAAARAFARSRGYARHMMAVGPFGHTTHAAHDRVFEVEYHLGREKVKVDRVYRDRWRTTSFRVLPLSDWTRSVDVASWLGDEPGCYYAVIQVKVAEAGPRVIYIEAGGSFKMWLNGGQVMDGLRHQEFLPDEMYFEEEFAAGWNRIVVKLSQRGRSSFALAVRDLQLNPDPGLTYEEGRVIHPVKIRAHSPVGARVSRGAFRMLATLSRKPGGPDPQELMAYARMLDYHRAEPIAVSAARQAAAMRPDDAMLQWQLGYILEQAVYLPDNKRRNSARQAYENALKARPDLVPARLALAQQLSASSKTEEALSLLEAGLALGHGVVKLRAAMADLFADRSWDTEALLQWKLILRARPDHPDIQLLMARRHWRLNNPKKALKIYRDLFARDAARTGIGWLLARHMLVTGKKAEAVALGRKLVATAPNDAATIQSLVSLLTSADQHEAAFTEVRRLAHLYPQAAGLQAQMANMRQRRGYAEEAHTIMR
ncbi:hypothetical protein JYT83_00115, partial [bacterium AH-315-F18]|nr:hypothetical protein [bacterium AH-315-F18]